MRTPYLPRLRRAIPLVVAIGLFTSVFTAAPDALAAAPVINSVTPSSGPTTGGTSITVTGTDFTSAPGFHLDFDGAQITNTPSNSVTFTTPSHAVGTVDILVHTDLGDSHISFLYVNPTYSVTYDGNCSNTCGTIPSDGTAYTAGGTVPVGNAPGLNKSGYTFGGWATGGGLGPVVTYSPGASFTINANTTLTAVWNLVTTFTVTYDGNCSNTCGSVPATATYTNGSLVTIGVVPTGTKLHYTFGGWAYGGLQVYQPGQTFSPTGNVTLTAVWTLNPYTVTYLFGDSSTGLPPTDGNSPYISGATVTILTQNTLLKTGYHFGGWKDFDTHITFGPTFIIVASHDLLPVWIPDGPQTVTFNSNYGTPTITTQSSLVPANLTANTFTRTGYTFNGWNTDPNGGGIGTGYADRASYQFVVSMTVYAQWLLAPTPTPGATPTPSTSSTPTPTPTPTPTSTSTTGTKVVFTITYIGNTNTTGLPPNPTVGNGLVTLASNTGNLIKNGYGFDGWNTTANGSGTSYPISTSYLLTANITLYAKWNPNIIYTITYDGNGSTGGVPPPTSGIGSVILQTNSGPLVESGQTFYGWNTKADGSGTSYRVAGSFLLSQNVTLYAVFLPFVVAKNPPSLIVNGKIINTAPPKKIALNQIVPVHQQFFTVLPKNVAGFQLYENGKFLLAGKSNTANLKSIVGPKDRVDVIAVGKDGSKSAPSPVTLSKDPISLANINFNTDSYKFIGPATKILDQVAAVMVQHGYTRLEVYGYVDTQGSKASWITLSNNRAKAVKDYMTKKLKGTGIIIIDKGRAQTQAVGNNNTAAGRALNRRVEIRVSY